VGTDTEIQIVDRLDADLRLGVTAAAVRVAVTL